jgi:hypothetical protein
MPTSPPTSLPIADVFSAGDSLLEKKAQGGKMPLEDQDVIDVQNHLTSEHVPEQPDDEYLEHCQRIG